MTFDMAISDINSGNFKMFKKKMVDLVDFDFLPLS